ncbi:MAG: AsmA family protein, partial [Burkholderiales bacterium]
VWQQRPIISHLMLTDANVDMERRADGLRNWRLVDPEDRGPGKVRVLTLQAERTKLRFLNEAIELDMMAQATPAETASQPKGKDALPSRLTFDGSYHGERFVAAGFAGSVLSFRESGLSFPLRGHLISGKTRIDVDGMFADIFDPGAIDATVRVAGPSLSRIHPFLAFQPPVSRPYVLEAQIKQGDKAYTFAKLHGKVGDTDIAGEATYDRNAERPVAKVSLRSEVADLADIIFLTGADYRANGSFAHADTGRARARAGVAAAAPKRAAPGKRMRAFDAHLQLQLKKLKAAAVPMLESLRLAADLVDGTLKVTELDLGIAGGHITGALDYDGTVAHASLDARNIRLERFVPTPPSSTTSTGAIRARLRMTGHGDSVTSVLASAKGEVAAIVEGGRISNLVDAKLGLNVGKIIGLKFRGDRDIELTCGAAAFDFNNGIGKSQVVLLETEQTHTDGAGTIDLRERNIDLLLTPQPKNPGFLTLNSSIHVQGPLHKPGFKIEERVPLAPAGIVAPPAAVAAIFRPLLETRQAGGQCAAVLNAQGVQTRAVVVKK